MAEGSSNMDWQTALRRLHQRASHILQSGQWSDCTFVVGNENNQQTLHGHRLILAMSSPVFEAMFFGGMPEKSDKPIEILDVQPEAFRSLLQYIYTDDINLRSFDQVCEICYAAKKYMIPSLVEQCTQFIWRDLHPGNVCRAYEFAHLFEEPRLIDKCLQIIQKDTGQVLKDPSFESIDAVTLCKVLQQDTLSVGEAAVWEACVRWARQECTRQSLAVIPSNQRSVLADFIGFIRFLTLSPTEFANGPAVSGLLTQEESYTLLMNISAPGVTTVPEPFSHSREKRLKEPTPPANLSLDMRGSSRPRESPHIRCECAGEVVADVLLNEQLVDCSLTFTVDKNVCIYGMEVPTQLNPESIEQQGSMQGSHPTYSELIYAFLQDSDGARLTYTHFTARVAWNTSVQVIFNRPVYISANKTYKIVVVLNKVGRYPLFVTSQFVTISDILFTFGTRRSTHGLGLLKAIVFGCTTHEQDRYGFVVQ